ncbi:hypothetical protein PENTCL1PPCAC_25732, partial [Pristionchus entomophagus]
AMVSPWVTNARPIDPSLSAESVKLVHSANTHLVLMTIPGAILISYLIAWTANGQSSGVPVTYLAALPILQLVFALVALHGVESRKESLLRPIILLTVLQLVLCFFGGSHFFISLPDGKELFEFALLLVVACMVLIPWYIFAVRSFWRISEDIVTVRKEKTGNNSALIESL